KEVENVKNSSSLNSTSWTTANLVSSGLMGLCFMVGVPGNIGVILFIVRHFKKDNFTVHLMLNLAAADILCLITLPVWIYNQLYSWSISQLSCKFFTTLVYCSAYSSLITVTMLSLYRCLQIRHPQLWSRMSKRRERALLVSGWALALLFSCPGVLTQDIIEAESKKSCGRILYSEEYRLTVAILEMLLAFFLPFTIMLTSYCCLHKKVTQGAFRHRQRLTKLVTQIVVTFFIFYAPHHIINLFQIFEILLKSSLPVFSAKLHEIRNSTGDIAGSLTFINSCVNPFLYAVASKTLRQQK
uniref:G-protein coupled receptors family 1 profile domain-containing protein n=1 Tax=Cyprinus carpio TaxID=7962 RepID=A0A8C1TIU4_CYPCA